MNPIAELTTAHRAIETALDILEHIVRQMETSGVIDSPSDVMQLVDFFRIFADKCHHSKEEKHLFPELERLGVSRRGGPIGVMLAEHDQGRLHIQAMHKALDDYAAADRGALEKLTRHARAYIGLLRRHIEKEDSILFRIADQQLPENKKSALAQTFEKIEQEIVGAGKHEALHAMLDRMEKTYLLQTPA